ncbi:adenylosuccinate lyase [Streptomyces cyaneus]|uniref:adenylosuccinate lyase n=1 Tax=Streptomyces cyaneus TaxID=1904 RepID=UPI00142EA651|nr:adenylosuccinate lyase [Streptomyces cyaneus]
MIDRYVRPEMSRIWTEEATFARWVAIESLVARVQAEHGIIPAEAAETIAATPGPDISDVREAERTRDHEVLSFLAAWTKAMPDESARWVHHGLTSYDLVDTGLGLAMRDAVDLVLDAARELYRVLARRALEHWDTICVGRTHGIHAEPIRFGHKLATLAFAVDRSLTRLSAVRESVAVGTISGAVGTYATTTPAVEAEVLAGLGLTAEPAPTQVVCRDRHAELVAALAVLGASVEQLALEMRLLQRTEVAEVEEPRTSAYQGSSAMPHKRNPTTSERLCGLARLLRANVGAALEDVALWHERDLAHSSVERVVLPDSCNLAYYQVTAATELVDGLVVNTDRMAENLGATRGRIFSAQAYLQMTRNGVEREHAYRTVQQASLRSLQQGTQFADELGKDGIAFDESALDPKVFLQDEDVVRTRLHERLREHGTVTRP